MQTPQDTASLLSIKKGACYTEMPPPLVRAVHAVRMRTGSRKGWVCTLHGQHPLCVTHNSTCVGIVRHVNGPQRTAGLIPTQGFGQVRSI